MNPWDNPTKAEKKREQPIPPWSRKPGEGVAETEGFEPSIPFWGMPL